jgi:DNA polymerase-3 subunit beta
MKLVCTQENLAKALSVVSRISTTKTTLPILGNVLLTTQKGRLKISSTDLEIGISTWIGAKINKEGSLTVPTRLLSEFVTTNTDKNIILSQDGEVLELTSDHYNAHIKGLPAADFPIIPEVKADFTFEVAGTALAETINQTAFATALDDTRPVLTGVLLKIDKRLIKVVATDSFRLAEKNINITSPPLDGRPASQQILIPSRTLQEISRLLSESIEVVKIAASSNQVQFNLADSQLVSRLLDGEFPDYTQIIPSQKRTTIIVRRDEAINAIKMASYFAKEASGNVKLKVDKKNILQVIATSPQLGDNVSRLTGTIQGEELEISFNARYLLDALEVMDEERVVFELNGKLDPGVLKPEKAQDYLYIIMPLRLGE